MKIEFEHNLFKTKEEFDSFNDIYEVKTNFKNIKDNDQYININYETLFKSFFNKKAPSVFFNNCKNLNIAFFIIFSPLLYNDKKTKTFISFNSFKFEVEKSSFPNLNVIVDKPYLIFNQTGNYTSRNFQTGSVNIINKEDKDKFGITSSTFNKCQDYISCSLSGPPNLNITKLFTAKIGDHNFLDLMFDESEVLKNNFVHFFDNKDEELYSKLKEEYKKFKNGEYNKVEVDGIEKQILIPEKTAEGGYLSLSPMINSAIAFDLKNILNNPPENSKKTSSIQFNSYIGGGEKAQNVSYTNQLIGSGSFVNFKMNMPKKTDNLNRDLYKINNKAPVLDTDELKKLAFIESKDFIPNQRKQHYREQLVNNIAHDFMDNIKKLEKNKDTITNKNWQNLIEGNFDFHHKKTFIEEQLLKGIGSDRQYVDKDLLNNILNKIMEIV